MNFDHTFQAVKRNGNGFDINDMETWRAVVESYKPGTILSIGIKKWRQPKSQRQLGAIFGLAYNVLGEWMGERNNAHIHGYCIIAYRQATGGKLSTKKTSLAEMDTREASEYFEWLQHWAVAEHGVMIPDPDPAWMEKCG